MRKTSNDRNHSLNYFDSAAHRCLAELALQQRLGLLSERRVRTTAYHRDYPIDRRQGVTRVPPDPNALAAAGGHDEHVTNSRSSCSL